MTFLCKWQGI